MGSSLSSMGIVAHFDIETRSDATMKKLDFHGGANFDIPVTDVSENGRYITQQY